jgi:predicted transcriptional regulator
MTVSVCFDCYGVDSRIEWSKNSKLGGDNSIVIAPLAAPNDDGFKFMVVSANYIEDELFFGFTEYYLISDVDRSDYNKTIYNSCKINKNAENPNRSTIAIDGKVFGAGILCDDSAKGVVRWIYFPLEYGTSYILKQFKNNEIVKIETAFQKINVPSRKFNESLNALVPTNVAKTTKNKNKDDQVNVSESGTPLLCSFDESSGVKIPDAIFYVNSSALKVNGIDAEFSDSQIIFKFAGDTVRINRYSCVFRRS